MHWLAPGIHLFGCEHLALQTLRRPLLVTERCEISSVCRGTLGTGRRAPLLPSVGYAPGGCPPFGQPLRGRRFGCVFASPPIDSHGSETLRRLGRVRIARIGRGTPSDAVLNVPSVRDTIVLALAAAVYPTLLAGVIVILSRPRPFRLLVGFLAGGMAISVVLGFVIVALLRQSDRVVGVDTTTKPVVDVLAGLVSIVVGWLVWTGRLARRRPRLPHRKSGSGWTERVLGRGSIWYAVAAGVLLNLPGVWYVAALANIAQDTPLAYRVGQILVFNVIMFTLVEVPLVMYLVNPERARRTITTSGAWVRDHRREVVAVLAAGIGVFLVIKGCVAFAKQN
jgi:hypothetical protein